MIKRDLIYVYRYDLKIKICVKLFARSIDFSCIYVPIMYCCRSVPACTDVAWLKQTLTVLQNRHNNISRKEKKDVQLETIFATTDFRYTFANLDMLVISDVSII